ncbi:MAG TPA: ATP-dependent DNA helicase [Fusobacterium sp.]|uniref:ATP-dependent DNA helicase n=1 Tax=Fusobacterium sp. TaxID=68766 RepID=UPI002F40C2EC
MLDKNQQRVVQYTEGPLLVIAGPGSGKTKTLVERSVFLISEKKIEPSQILLSTFTEKAARELRMRIQKTLQEKGNSISIEEMYLGTMHSIWLRILEEYITYSHYENGIEVLDEEEEKFFLYSQLRQFKTLDFYTEFFEREHSYGDWAQSRLLQSIFSKIQEEAVDITSICSYQEEIQFLKSAYKLYQSLLWRENKISFSAIQMELYHALLEHSEFLEEIQNKIRYIMIDEYQDSNPIQEKIILLLTGKEKNICVVGDEDQAIYRFRGATVENILRFPRVFEEDCETMYLEKNYRSAEEIVHLCNQWMKRIDWQGERFDKQMYSARYESIERKSVFRISGSPNPRKRKELISWLQELKEKKKVEDYSQIVFLFDNFRSPQVKRLEEDLEMAGIPVYCPRARNFFSREEVKLFFGFFLALSPEVQEEVKNYSYYEDCLFRARKWAKENLSLQEWILEKRKTKLGDFLEYYYQILSFSPFREILEKQEENRRKGREIYNISLIGNMIQSFQRLCKIKEERNIANVEYLKYFFQTYLKKFIEKGVNEFEKKGEFPKGCIPFLTIHQSKGLEFPIVIVSSLYQNPPIYREKIRKSYDSLFQKKKLLQEHNEELYDFYRKFYVAFSRAKNALVFFDYDVSSSFQGLVHHSMEISPDNFPWEDIPEEKYNGSEEAATYSYTTDIASYALCPRRYFFLRKISFPSMEKENFLFGSLLHKCLEKIHKYDKNKDLLENLIQKEREYLEKRSKFSFQREELEKAKAILEEYQEKSKFLYEKIIQAEKKEFLEWKGSMVYGEIDLLAFQENQWKIIDFKTGKKNPMYTEQLVLYEELLKKYQKDRKILLSLYYLLEQREEKIELSLEEREKILDKMQSTIHKIQKKDFPKRDYQKEICDLCEFYMFCYRKENL